MNTPFYNKVKNLKHIDTYNVVNEMSSSREPLDVSSEPEIIVLDNSVASNTNGNINDKSKLNDINVENFINLNDELANIDNLNFRKDSSLPEIT